MKGPWPVRAAFLLVLGSCTLGACTRPPPPGVARPAAPKAAPKAKRQQPIKTVQTVVERCPSNAEIARLRAAKPTPLRDRQMPRTAAERVARIAAQLGLYEARGQWADQVEKAFRDCEGK